jgi:hypothetical protein
MRTHGYSAEELSRFYAVLDRAVREAAERELSISIPMMVQRLFSAADRGERNGERLIDAIFIGVRTRSRDRAAA